MDKTIYNFLKEAKKVISENKELNKVASSRRGSRDYSYISGDFTYHNSYFGGINFIGEEVVYFKDDIPIWGMNYYGNIYPEIIYKYKNLVLPSNLLLCKNGIIPENVGRKLGCNYNALIKHHGNFENFSGEEEIYKNDIKVYELKYHGGTILK